MLLLKGKKDRSQPRNPAAWKGLRLIALRSWPRREFVGATAFTEVMGYVFHIGLFAGLFFYLPHILFFEDVAKGLIGVNFKDAFVVAWPYFPGGVIYFFRAVSVAALLAVLVHRLTNPVKKLISNFDDYFSWFVTIAPIVTGMLAYSHVGGAVPDPACRSPAVGGAAAGVVPVRQADARLHHLRRPQRPGDGI